MKVNNEEAARRLIEEQRALPAAAQLRNLRLAVENLELDQMYYEQKGNEQGGSAARSVWGSCVAASPNLGERVVVISNG